MHVDAILVTTAVSTAVPAAHAGVKPVPSATFGFGAKTRVEACTVQPLTTPTPRSRIPTLAARDLVDAKVEDHHWRAVRLKAPTQLSDSKSNSLSHSASNGIVNSRSKLNSLNENLKSVVKTDDKADDEP